MELPKGIYQRGAGYQAKVKLGSTRFTGTFPTLEGAKRYLAAAQAAHKVGKTVPLASDFLDTDASKVVTVQDVYDRVWAKRWAHQKSSEDGSPGNARRYIAWCGPDMPAKDAFDEMRLLTFLNEKKDAGNSDSTLTHYQAALGPLISEALRLHLISMRPELPKRKAGKVRLRVLTPEEEDAMMGVLIRWPYPRHAGLFAFLIDTGVRPGEAQKLTWEDFDLATKRVHLEADITKNSTRRTLGLTKRALEVVQRERDNGLAGPFSWASPKKRLTRTIVEKLREHLGWDKQFVVYTFRHTCASRLVQRGVDLYRVQIWMGHKSILQTQRYAKFAPKQITDLADVLEP